MIYKQIFIFYCYPFRYANVPLGVHAPQFGIHWFRAKLNVIFINALSRTSQTAMVENIPHTNCSHHRKS